MTSQFKILFIVLNIILTFSFSKNKEVTYGFERNKGDFSYTFRTPLYEDMDGYHNRNYKSFLANSFKINFLENNRIYSAFLTYGVCYGEGIYTSVDYNFSDIYTFRKPFISISYMYGIYDITKISFFQKYSKLNLFEYFKISPSVTYSMHRMEDLEPRIPFEGTLLIGVKVNFIKLGFLFPYLQYEKAIGLVNDRYTYGLSLSFYKLKKLKSRF